MPKTAYELQREANIARNRALIEQLELKSAVEALGFPSKSKSGSATAAKAKPIQPTKRVKKEKEAVDTPRRQSTRLKRAAAPVDLDESPAKRRRREKDEEEERRREEEERLAAEERAREARQPRHHDLDLSTLAMQEEWESGSLPGVQHLFTSLLATPNARLPAEGDAFVLGDAKEAAEVTALRERLSGMRVVARAKVTQERVYSMAYHPEVTKDVIFVGDKHGQLGIWDVRAAPDEQDDETPDVPASEREGGKYWRLQPHWPSTSKSSISCIKFDPLDAHSVYTSAYDCTVRQLSFESGVAREVLSTDDVLITSMDLPPASHEMWVSDTAGGLTHVDLREKKARGRWYQLSDQKIGSVSVNPRNPAYLLTASNSRSLKVWDSRKLAKIKPVAVGEDIDNEKVETFVKSPFGRGTLRAEFPHGKSVSSAYWDPRGRTIVSTSYDDTLRLWDVNPSSLAKDGPFPNFKPFSQLGHNCQTGRWLTVLKAQWSQNPDVYPHFTIGSMKHSLDILSCKGDLLASLSDKTVITAVQAVTCSHPSIVERAASGNGSGRCVLWAPEDLKI